MRLFRLTRACAAVGQCARQNFTPSRPLSAPRLLAGEPSFTQPANTLRIQTRLNSSVATDSPSETTPQSTTRIPPTDISNIPTLFAPYKFSDLSPFEQEAYYKYGPNYLEHLKPNEKKRVEHALRRRKAHAAIREAQLGSDWYSIVKAFSKKRDQENAEFHAQIKEKKAEAVKMRQFPEGLPRSEKNERERQASKAYASIRAEFRQYHQEYHSESKRAADLKQFAAKIREQQTA